MTTPIDVAPFFVGGPLHGKPVPGQLVERYEVLASSINPDVVYIRTVWWRISGPLVLFARAGMPCSDFTSIVAHELKQRKWRRITAPRLTNGDV